MTFNIDNSKSYKTEKNLERALDRDGLHDFRRLVVCNRAGRFTAIFPLAWNEQCNAGLIAHLGYFVVG